MLSPLRYLGDAFLETLQAELCIAKFVSGFKPPMTSLRCGRHQVALQFGNARTHLPGLVLAQRLDPSTPTHRSSRQNPHKACPESCQGNPNFSQAQKLQI